MSKDHDSIKELDQEMNSNEIDMNLTKVDDNEEDLGVGEDSIIDYGEDSVTLSGVEEKNEVLQGNIEPLNDILENPSDDDDNVSTPGQSDTSKAVSGIYSNGIDSPKKSGLITPDSIRHSSDTFPALNHSRTPSESYPVNTFRRPAAHPQISRLRSTSTQQQQSQQQQQQQQRFPSNSSSHSTFFDRIRRPLNDNSSASNSGFDLMSRVSSISNLNEVLLSSGGGDEDLSQSNELDPSTVLISKPYKAPTDTFKWSPLRRISQKIYHPTSSNSLGVPTVLAVSGVIAVGTSKGWVMIFDFGQNLKCVCGTELTANEGGAVTALGISQDHTFIAVGHANGFIHLYALNQPLQPARSVPPTTLALVSTGRKEGHLIGSTILHIGFVGARHTAIISSDETGLAFYHSLGKILMLASTDIIRMLGKYPEFDNKGDSSPFNKNNNSSSSKIKKPSTVLDMTSLPLGPTSHSSDNHSLVAILTPTKLVIVGLKPTPRTWWRATPENSSASFPSKNGVLAWYPCDILLGSTSTSSISSNSSNSNIEKEGEDPILAFAWGKKLRLVKVGREREKEVMQTNGNRRTGGGGGEKLIPKKVLDMDFIELEGWECEESILGLQWYNQRVIFTLSAHYVDIYDITTRTRIGRDSHDILKVVSHDFYSSAFGQENVLSYSGSFKTHKRKIFLLTLTNIQAGAVLSWADRVLGLMQPGSILEAIEVTTSYLLGHNDASTITLPDDLNQRRKIVEPKLREILTSSIDFVFSEDRLRDGSHDDSSIMKNLFEGLIGTCVRACLATGDIEWLFDELYERYELNGIEGIFLDKIEPFILSGSVHALPPSVSQRLIAIHEERNQFEAAQRIIWHVDPEYLDLNQVLGLCQRQKLYDALIYVYTRSMHDYISPIIELLSLVRRIQRHRKQRPRRIGEEVNQDEMKGQEDVELMAPDAYKVYGYLSQALAGLSYPSKDSLSYEEGILARNSIYSFLFSPTTVTWPTRGGIPILASDDDGVESPYPYIRILLQFDAEAMLDALDLAFEESYLEDDVKGKPLNRQLIVNLLLAVMANESTEFTPVDRTFLHIFIARNLPKYPQYIQLQPSVLHEILIKLASDPDQSTIDDRQLAAEYLLSTYTPPNGNAMILLFEEAGFLRILRSIYRGERRWAELVSTYLRDSDVEADIFRLLRDTLRLASRTNEDQKKALAEIILEAVPSLVQADEAGLQQTAELVDEFLSSHHSDVITRLSSTPWRQFAYLRCLLEPSTSPEINPSSTNSERLPSSTLDTSQRLLYLSLLCQHEPSHVIRYLDSDAEHMDEESEAVLKICEKAEVFDAFIWTLDQRGDTKAALDKVDDTLESSTDLLVHSMLSSTKEEVEGIEGEEGIDHVSFRATPSDAILEKIAAVSNIAIQICVTRTVHRSSIRGEDELTGEELWFRLLSSLVTTVRAIRAISPTPLPPLSTRPSDRSTSNRRVSGASIIFHDEEVETEENSTSLSIRSLDILSSLIPNALSALVSNTSTREVSFPNLMRKLINSNARSPVQDRSYSEFKAIVTSMLDTYAFEGEILSVTKEISAQDLFQHVEELKLEKELGWRCKSTECFECGLIVWGEDSFNNGKGTGIGGKLSRSDSVNLVVETLGMGGRPIMQKRPSLKGKEVQWPVESGAGGESRNKPLFEAPKGVVVGKEHVWHQSCWLLSKTNLGHERNERLKLGE